MFSSTRASKEEIKMKKIHCLLLLILFTISCGSRGVQMNSTIHRGPMPEGGTFAGIWFSNWGEMSLSTQGSSIVGQFCQEDRNRYGRLEGSAQGNVLTLHWITNDVTMSGSSRQTEGSAIVQFSFVEAGENRTSHFEGTWGYQNSNADGGILRGDRSPRRSEQFLRGVYSMSCPLRDQSEGGAPMSTEEVSDNPDDTGGSTGYDEGYDEGAGGEETDEGGDDSFDASDIEI